MYTCLRPSRQGHLLKLCIAQCAQNEAHKFGKYDNNKPNEDSAIFDRLNRIFIICDGVSHHPIPNTNGNRYPEKSISRLAAKVFAATVHSGLINLLARPKPSDSEDSPHSYYEAKLRRSIEIGNQAVYSLNKTYFKDTPDFINHDLGSTCAIVAFIRDKTFYYCYIGDCAGYRLPKATDSSKPAWERFTANQVAPYEAWRDSLSSEERQESDFIPNRNRNIRNNRSHNLSYGVVTGQPEALDMFGHGHFAVGPDSPYSQIALASDGYELLFTKSPNLLITKETDLSDLAKRINEDDNHTDDTSIIVIGF